MIDLRLAGAAREQARRSREDARRSRAVARGQREESIRLLWHARKLFFDRHGPVLAMWDGAELDEADGGSGAIDPRPEGSRPQGGSTKPTLTAGKEAVALVPDSAVRHLFGISVELAGVLELTRDPEVIRRIRQIISDAGDLIDEFRLAYSEAGSIQGEVVDARKETDIAAPGLAPDPPSDRRLAKRLLQEASFAIDRSLTFTRRQSGRAAGDLEVDLEEASWAVHRAIIALTA